MKCAALRMAPGGETIDTDWIAHHQFTGANIKNVFVRLAAQMLEARAPLGVLLDKEIQREHAMRSGYPFDYYDETEDCGTQDGAPVCRAH